MLRTMWCAWERSSSSAGSGPTLFGAALRHTCPQWMKMTSGLRLGLRFKIVRRNRDDDGGVVILLFRLRKRNQGEKPRVFLLLEQL
mmetsp:Transcript_3308/g.6353  ORF Transcript_3308/g.6353 Transcript_3308/m.6353 type:complete len:86 (+) Transcript_3308:819-1076(+)